LDSAHTFMALGYSTTGAAAAENFAKAAMELRRYLELVRVAGLEGRLTATAVDVLSSQAETIIGDLPAP